MSEILVVGDRVLVEPIDGEQQTESGILLPATVADKERVRCGRVIQTGPGYLTANPEYSDQPWKKPTTLSAISRSRPKLAMWLISCVRTPPSFL